MRKFVRLDVCVCVCMYACMYVCMNVCLLPFLKNTTEWIAMTLDIQITRVKYLNVRGLKIGDMNPFFPKFPVHFTNCSLNKIQIQKPVLSINYNS